MSTDKYQQRLYDLFSSIDRLTSDSLSDTPAIKAELDLLRNKIYELEVQLKELSLQSKKQETQSSRSESQSSTPIEAKSRGWDYFLDGIHHKERIGYAYNQAEIFPFIDPIHSDTVIEESIKVQNEPIGVISLKPNPSQTFTEEDKHLISAVSTQVAEQIENIRLLTEATRAREEAEETTRLFIRENWKEYTNQKEDLDLQFIYDSNQVLPLENNLIPQNLVIQQPLMLRGEIIGQLAVSGLKNVTNEEIELAHAIATQTSIHLEALRLTEELQKRAYQLQELDRVKSAFLANMSHELRTPLNSILGFTDVMLEGIDGPITSQMDNDLKLINKNGQHLLHLINDVLDMAKIESGKLNLIIEKFNIQEIFEEVINITSPLANEKKLTLKIDTKSDNDVEVNADRTRIRQVMINLVNNALKFTEKGKIIVRAIREENNVLISVKDTGIGIPSEHLEAVFNEFTQVDSSTTRKVGGTGLGLPISRKLIEMHGGKLWAESNGIEGEGSTFFIFMPLENRTAISEPVTRKI